MPAPPDPIPAPVVRPRLTTDSLGHAFGPHVLYRQLALALGPGETLAVTGRNGAGKSTLAQTLAGLRAPRKGTVALTMDDALVPVRPNAALVAPAVGLYDGLSPREHLVFVAKARGDRALAVRADAVLAFVGLGRRADDPVGTFSSGLRQRVRYACALLPAPALLVLDEPTANLDADGLALVDRVRAWQTGRGGLLVVATNDPAEAAWGDVTVAVGDGEREGVKRGA